jgi:hypothetical protein
VTDDYYGIWIRIRVKLRTLNAVRTAARLFRDVLHREARVEADRTRRADLIAEADYIEVEEKELQHAQMLGMEEAGKKPGGDDDG